MVQIGDLAATLGQMGSDVGDMINDGLVFLMTHTPSFVEFCVDVAVSVAEDGERSRSIIVPTANFTSRYTSQGE